PPPTLAEQLLGPPPQLPTPAASAAWNQADELTRMSAGQPPSSGGSVQKRATALDRQLGGPVFAESSASGSQTEGATTGPTSVQSGSSEPPWTTQSSDAP